MKLFYVKCGGIEHAWKTICGREWSNPIDYSGISSPAIMKNVRSLGQSFPNAWYHMKRMLDIKLRFVNKDIILRCTFTAVWTFSIITLLVLLWGFSARCSSHGTAKIFFDILPDVKCLHLYYRVVYIYFYRSPVGILHRRTEGMIHIVQKFRIVVIDAWWHRGENFKWVVPSPPPPNLPL